MKKTLSFMLVLVMLVSVLAGCGNKNESALPDGISGSDAVRLLLANERLNAQLLKSDGDIFENGVEVMNNLAETAVENLNIRYDGGNAHSVVTLASVETLSTVLEGDYSGKVEINGDTFVWSGFEENNNSYDSFKSITENIVVAAGLGADLIDDIKKNVRVVDKWVRVGETCYYLSVDENSEMLCEKDETNNILKICKRYKNGDGDDVYELYMREDIRSERMTYIPGKRYELSMIEGSYGGESYFVADNSKGYWETYTLGVNPDNYNVSYFIMKNDICYDAFYEPMNGNVPLLKIMSSDRATDILNFGDSEGLSAVDLKFSGFDGIKSVEAPSASVEYDESTGYANIPNGDNCKVHLTNGKTLSYGDTFADGNASINAIHVGFIGGFGYTGEMMLNIRGETYEERLAVLKTFLNETGLQCKRNIDSVLTGIERAYTDLESVIKYYTWNGISVTDSAGIEAAVKKEKTRFDEMEALYTAIKDVEVLDISDAEIIELNINFAPITESSFNGVTFDAMNVSVDSISLTIEDTTLYVKDEPYKAAFALADANGKLVHLDVENASESKYADEDKFTVSASSLNFTLPALSSGSYTLVAYIATSDGIRASAYTAVTVSEIANASASIENMAVTASKTSSGALALTYEQITDFAVTLTTDGRVGYEEFKTAVSELVFEYGTPSDVIEVGSGDTYTALTGSETEIADGTYRSSYQVQNGDSVVQGYIYIQYSCK